MDVRVFPMAELAAAAARAVAGWLDDGSPRLGLAGGATPKDTYRELGRLAIDWSRMTLWLGDERWVRPDDPDSNQRMARRHLAAPGAMWLTPEYPAEGPVDSAYRYEQTLDGQIGDDAGVLLAGMGADGHTLSLFPGGTALAETTRLYVAEFIPSREQWRLTATLPLVRRARRLVFLAVGESKAGALRQVFDGTDLPAKAVAECGPATVWFVDEAAASRL
ncbi:MAG: 6-phosphogluconolactonase [Acidimicrobiia bacterium]